MGTSRRDSKAVGKAETASVAAVALIGHIAMEVLMVEVLEDSNPV